MGIVGEQSPREILLAHARGSPAAEGRGSRMASLRRGGVQSLGTSMSGPRRRFFRVPWRTSRQIRQDVDDELRFHLDMRVEGLTALGAPLEAARTRSEE